MSEMETQTEIETDAEVNSVEDLIKSIETGNFTDAQSTIYDLIASRQSDYLDQAKVRIAQDVYNYNDDEEEESESDEIESEEDFDEDDFEIEN